MTVYANALCVFLITIFSAVLSFNFFLLHAFRKCFGYCVICQLFYFDRKPKSSEFTLGQFLHRQRFAVHGTEARRLKYLPKVRYIHWCLVVYTARNMR